MQHAIVGEWIIVGMNIKVPSICQECRPQEEKGFTVGDSSNEKKRARSCLCEG